MPNLNRNQKQDEQYVLKSFPDVTDLEMANHLRISVGLVRKIRAKLKLIRPRWSETRPETIGIILEMFANGKTVIYISKLTKIQINRINRIIESYWFYKKRSYDTITMVMDSKINY